MSRIFRIASVIWVSLSQLFFVSPAFAEPIAPSIVISQLATGDTLSATNEFVELYNNSNTDVDITNWCVRYLASTGSVQSTPRYCFTPVDAQTSIVLVARQYALLVTPNFAMPGGGSPDGRFIGSGMAAGGGHGVLRDKDGMTVDMVGWGTAIAAEGSEAAAAPTASQSLRRKVVDDDRLIDTDNNKNDFELTTPLLHGGGVREERVAIDLCGNREGIQETLPPGYGYDEAGNCELLADDLCTNIDAIQLEVPDGLHRSGDGRCDEEPVDVCRNIQGIQVVLPDGYAGDEGICIRLEDRELWLSEMLPNVKGADSGLEFIELYNPHDEPILLDGYVLSIGKTFEKSYPLSWLTDKISIPAHGYITVSDSELGFTLLNTLSGVRLVAPAGNTVSETVYTEPKDDHSWAYIDRVWQYTIRVTPGQPNMMTPDEGDVESAHTVAPCPAGKYRNPLTNRCRTIEADVAILADCQEGYYRNPDTNRCRKITLTAALVPCQPGSTRNPETNRCRKDDTGDALVPCKAGQERNPITNRCRNGASLASPLANPAAAQPPAVTNSMVPWVLTMAGLGVVGYGVFEWRHEIGSSIGKFIGRFKK